MADVQEDSFFSIAGSQVRMPAGLKPFPSQFAVMSKCISALRNGQNALLESREFCIGSNQRCAKKFETFCSDWNWENLGTVSECSKLAT